MRRISRSVKKYSADAITKDEDLSVLTSRNSNTQHQRRIRQRERRQVSKSFLRRQTTFHTLARAAGKLRRAKRHGPHGSACSVRCERDPPPPPEALFPVILGPRARHGFDRREPLSMAWIHPSTFSACAAARPRRTRASPSRCPSRRAALRARVRARVARRARRPARAGRALPEVAKGSLPGPSRIAARWVFGTFAFPQRKGVPKPPRGADAREGLSRDCPSR